MKAEITLDGKIEITPGSITELYAIKYKVDNCWWEVRDFISINDRNFEKTTENEVRLAPEKEISIEDIPF